MFRLKGEPEERDFLNQVIQRSGQNLLDCLQCGKCTGSCPVASEEVGGPRRLIAEILCGMKKRALEDPTWWFCVSCGSCVTRCPVEINMSQVATILCEMAEKEGIEPSERGIHLFDELFLKSVEKYGRVRELRTVMFFNMRTFRPHKDWRQGLALMRKGAVSPKEMVFTGPRDQRIARIFKNIHHEDHGE